MLIYCDEDFNESTLSFFEERDDILSDSAYSNVIFYSSITLPLHEGTL
jgi:hypothetical protein